MTRRQAQEPDEATGVEPDGMSGPSAPGPSAAAAARASAGAAAPATAPVPARSPRGAPGRTLQGLPGGRDDDSPLALDRLIHERLRLGIVSALAVNEALTFVELKRLLKTTDGNLSVHARKLEEAGYISCTKEFEGRTPRTEYRLTRAGRLALERYLEHMDALIKATRQGAKS
jgi:DNA-binding HxlR family transcriptional regulator